MLARLIGGVRVKETDYPQIPLTVSVFQEIEKINSFFEQLMHRAPQSLKPLIKHSRFLHL